MILEVLINLGKQLLYSVGIVVIFGFIVSIFRKIFYKIAGRAGYITLLVTGAVGTPVHELSHAFMCVIFGHKIYEMSLFDPTNEDGTLGYVYHYYNPKNIFQQIGNFFIGIAPLICSSAVLFILMVIFVNDVFLDVNDILISVMTFSDFSGELGIFDFIVYVQQIILVIFNPANLSNVWWWVFIVLAIMICSHMELSGADIKSGFVGFIYLTVLLFIINLVTYYLDPSIPYVITSGLMGVSMPVISYLTLSAVFLLALVVIALIVKIIISVVGLFVRR